MIEGKRILIAPLNWGLGHASRCVPLIRQLKEKNELLLAADGNALTLLRAEFPDLESIRLPDIEMSYPRFLPFPLYFGLKLPSLINAIKKEHRQLQKLIREQGIEVVVSDNRYGLYHQDVRSILITHQLFVKSPILEKQLQHFLHQQIRNFDECWIPDFEGEENLSGSLSHGTSSLKNLKFIGPLSRFEKPLNEAAKYQRKLLVILSGPEPNRTSFEKKLIEQLLNFNQKALLVQGKVSEKPEIVALSKSVELISHLPTQQLRSEILQSEFIVCRSGYSSVMDLNRLQKKAILVPTNGQSEQEYLADYLSKKGLFLSAEEKDFNLKKLLAQF